FGLQPDIILTIGATVTVTVQRETRTIPIVFAYVGDPGRQRHRRAARPPERERHRLRPPTKPRLEGLGQLEVLFGLDETGAITVPLANHTRISNSALIQWGRAYFSTSVSVSAYSFMFCAS